MKKITFFLAAFSLSMMLSGCDFVATSAGICTGRSPLVLDNPTAFKTVKTTHYKKSKLDIDERPVKIEALSPGLYQFTIHDNGKIIAVNVEACMIGTQAVATVSTPNSPLDRAIYFASGTEKNIHLQEMTADPKTMKDSGLRFQTTHYDLFYKVDEFTVDVGPTGSVETLLPLLQAPEEGIYIDI